MEILQELEKIIEECGVFEYGVIAPKRVSFMQEVRAMCEVNSCGTYGTRWICPPGIGSIQECRERCLEYQTMLVFTGKYELEDSFDYEGMIEGIDRFKKMVRMIDKAVNPLLTTYLLLGNEGCDRCETCTYPVAPCRFPQRVNPPIESMGIMVSELAKQIGIKYINGKNTITYFGALLF
ncbi:DUF2284 domain-containing protein [Clostridium sp. C105KSO13]|uniref:DUF2284 domain-containing protein n=1 Tax=Clostridium sp. C105KSO13 TaxID=1776045 RepID=UPI0007407B5A|nr:DUF2284 domain-containing protein [Clostridium sp. C105KSO13]CUX30233.1 hypothetical protein BN3456_01233 [Clostridium sp. C105KSO13]